MVRGGVGERRGGLRKTGGTPVPAGARAGFTLIELMVVLIIIALLIAIVVPALSHVRDSARRAGTQQILQNVTQAAAAFEPLITSGRVRELIEPAAKWAGDVAKTVSGVDYVRAMQVRRLIQQAFDELFEQYDLLLSPTMPIVAARIADKLETSFAYSDPLGSGGNLSGLPALSVPTGFSKAGLPTAMQIVGAPLSDRKALALGQLYQEATDWHRRRPPIVPETKPA